MRSRKFSSATGSPSTNAMFGIETPMGRTPLQGARRLASLHPGLKPLGYSVRPLRGRRKMSKLQRPALKRRPILGAPLPTSPKALSGRPRRGRFYSSAIHPASSIPVGVGG